MPMAMPHLYSPPPVVGHASGALIHPRLAVIPDGDIPRSWASASATTSNGNEIRISVRLACPPATSFVKVQSSADGIADKLKMLVRNDPTSRVVAARGDLLLICLPLVAAAAEDDNSSPYSSSARHQQQQHDLFVFRACVGRLCWLRRVPHAAHYYCWINDPLGIISLPGDDHFILADLQLYSSSPELDPATGQPQEMATAALVRYSSASDRWDLTPLAMPYDGDALKPFHWRTDKCFSSSTDQTEAECSTTIMYWVDYHLGLLRCDVGNSAPMLRFIRLPEIQSWKSYGIPSYTFLNSRMCPKAYRTAGACKGGTVIFVHVDNGLFGQRKKSGFTVNTWALKAVPEFEWREAGVLRVDDELWALPCFKDSPLPRWVPQFPMVSARQEGVLHFIMQEHTRGRDDWLITVDMQRKVLQSYENRIKTGW
ncbi:unnamed protein product [Urochloa humidicola]